jgi:hypothetical protein
VFTHDFPHRGVGQAIPYGTYDLTQDRAVVNVGVTHDTAEFAVESIRRWWRLMGQRSYPAARHLLVCADAGGSHGNRLRAWKGHLQRLATEVRFPITVCHDPPGTSQGNAIKPPTLLVHQYELEGAASGQLRGDRQSDRPHGNPNRTHSPARCSTVTTTRRGKR